MPKHEFKKQADILRCTVCNTGFFISDEFTEKEAWADECRGFAKPSRAERLAKTKIDDWWLVDRKTESG